MTAGADKIVSSIIQEAQSKADEIIQEAESESNSIIEAGKKEAQLEKEKILEDAKKQSRMKYQQIISEAKMNARRADLEAREEVIEESFQKAFEKLRILASTSSSEYKQSLIEIITEASMECGGGDLQVLIKVDDVEKVKNSLNDIEAVVEKETGTKTTLELGDNINTIGGAILKTKNGEIEVNNTIEARMQRFKKTLRYEVAKVLFE